jgi:hypothetical protein
VYTPGYQGASVSALEDIVERLPWSGIRRAVEVVVHPATRVEAGLFGTLTEVRVREYEILRDSGLADRLRSRGIMTTGFEAVSVAN